MRFADLIKRFRKDERGVFLVFFALIAVVLIAASGAVVDFTRVQQARTRAQIALDAAALALQGTINTSGVTAATLKVKAQALLTERIADSSVTAVVESATPDTTAGKLTIVGYISVPTYFVQLVGIKDIRSSMLSEVTRSSSDLEVSLSIDITGSMAPTYNWWGTKTSDKIGDLINASNTVIDLLVSTTQTPTYSKMAIVPWSYAANIGSYADSVRPIKEGVTISSATWISGTAQTITAIRQGVGARITTSANHGWSPDDVVYINGVSGMTNLNNNIYKVATVPRSDRITLKNLDGTDVDSTSWTAFSSSGTPKVARCLDTSCQVLVTTSAAHSLTSGASVYVANATGMTGLNATPHDSTVNSVPSTTTYKMSDVTAKTVAFNSYTANSATSYCVVLGCRYQYFTGQDNVKRLWKANNCATDRTTSPYTDTAPSTYPLTANYRDSSGSDCIPNQIVPLTSNRTTLHNAIGTYSGTRTLNATGSTAGHLGLAWGWYMISPNFGYLWPTASQPKAYGSTNLIKAVIFMTDGDFNTPYCNGIVANDALTGAGGSDDHINCASPNGSSQSQAQTICTNIKATANKTLLYVVGFDLAGNTAALNFLDACATDDTATEKYFFEANTGADLTNAFKAIAQNLSELRISK